jgi:hypothetical protein
MDEVTESIRTVVRRYPEIATALKFRRNYEVPEEASRGDQSFTVELVGIEGPYLNRAMTLFSARAGLALHWWGSDRVVPPTGHVHAFWFTNFSAIAGDVPEVAFNVFPRFNTLRQGSFNVRDQFEFASEFTEDGAMSMHTLTFRRAFMCLAFVSEGHNPLGRMDRMVRPDSFRERWPFASMAGTPLEPYGWQYRADASWIPLDPVSTKTPSSSCQPSST